MAKVRHTGGMVAAGHPLTAKAGARMLELGGNAFDAAIAASVASFVCESALTSPAGGGFLIGHVRREGVTLLYDFFSSTPGRGYTGKSDSAEFFPIEINFIGTPQELYIGRGSAAVPATMAGLDEVYRRHATLPLERLLEPAIEYAEEGIVLNERQAEIIHILAPMLTLTEEGKKIYAPSGRVLDEGDVIKNKALAETLRYLAREGFGAFFTGYIKDALLEAFSPPEGFITEEDLKEYCVAEREPLVVEYRDRYIYTNPPPSGGGVLIGFSLKLLEEYEPERLGHNSAAYIRLLYNIMKTADEVRRDEENPLGEEFLNLSKHRVATGNTTHISVMDEDGNAVGITTSVGIGCGYMIPGTGIMMNNMLGEDELNPDGFHCYPPGTRLQSMMSPTIIMDKDMVPAFVLGTGGSKRIRNAMVQTIVNILDFGFHPQKAVELPRVHWDGEILQLEEGIEREVVRELEEEGIRCNLWKRKHMYFGGVNMVKKDKKGFTAGADPRRGGFAIEVS